MSGVDIDGVSCELEDDLQDTMDDGNDKIQCGELVESQASILPIVKMDLATLCECQVYPGKAWDTYDKLDFIRDRHPREELFNTHCKDTRPRNKKK